MNTKMLSLIAAIAGMNASLGLQPTLLPEYKPSASRERRNARYQQALLLRKEHATHNAAIDAARAAKKLKQEKHDKTN